MPASDFIDSFRNISARVGQTEVPLQGIKSDCEIDEQFVYEHGVLPVGRTLGQAKPKGEMTGRYRSFVTLAEAVATQYGSVLGGVFEITKSVGFGDQAVITTVYKKCRFLNWSEDAKTGSDALQVTTPFSFTDAVLKTPNGDFRLLPE